MAILLAFLVPLQAEAAPAPFCQCVTYIQNYVGHINTYYAKDAGRALKAIGYREIPTPMGVNDIVVLQPGFAGASSAGHIAFLASYGQTSNKVHRPDRRTPGPESGPGR